VISVIVFSRESKKGFKEHLIATSGLGKNIEVLEYTNNGTYSLTEIYNKGLNESRYNIVVFCHDDIEVNSESWGITLLDNFNKNPDYGILGVLGVTQLDQSGNWLSNSKKLYGRLTRRDPITNKMMDLNCPGVIGNSIKEVIALYGVFFTFDKSKIKSIFDKSFKEYDYHDISFTFQNHLDGVKIGVFTNIHIIHISAGNFEDQTPTGRMEFVRKYSSFLPKSISINIPVKDISIDIQNEPKLAIVIPTKDKYALLSSCINSILDKTKYKNYKIFIADTGSTMETKKLLREFYIEKYDNIHLIEYDYYNFAKINNDVVKNHIDEDTELVLFCNNDIKLLNDTLSIMVKCYLDNIEKAGTIGCRLHYENGSLQHLGIVAYKTHDSASSDAIFFTHLAFGQDFNDLTVEEIISTYGNTAACMMISKRLFNKYGGFNEKYEICFEDVELNLKALLDGKYNYTCTDAVSYHYESQTRGKIISNTDYNRIRNFTVDTGLNKFLS
jgi:GT2 family glycosyltransferase